MRLPFAGPVRWVPLVVVVVLGSACGGGTPADVPAIPVSVSVLPAGGELAGWSQATDLESYDADSLWEHINGQADFFIDYGFVRVDAAEYRHDEEPRSVVLEVYEMGRPQSWRRRYGGDVGGESNRFLRSLILPSVEMTMGGGDQHLAQQFSGTICGAAVPAARAGGTPAPQCGLAVFDGSSDTAFASL